MDAERWKRDLPPEPETVAVPIAFMGHGVQPGADARFAATP